MILLLKKVRDALKKITEEELYHYEGNSKAKQYIVWSEDGEVTSLSLDNAKNTRVITGTIDLFTHIEFDSWIDEIQNTLDLHGISYMLESVQYETDQDIIHYAWRFEVS